MSNLNARRWTLHGNDRLYVQRGTERLGSVNLLSGEVVVGNISDHAAVEEFARKWCARNGLEIGSHVQESDLFVQGAARPDVQEWEDLTLRRPGHSVRAKIDELVAAAPIRSLLSRLFGIRNEERGWRVGLAGEVAVGRVLDSLARRDPRWMVLHAVPVGSRDSDIDHVLLGPAGVFTLNTKHHPNGNLWVGGDVVMLNGEKVPYVRNTRFEASRAEKLLGVATGSSTSVTGVIVPVGLRTLKVKTAPEGVIITSPKELTRWLRRQPDVFSPEHLARLQEMARRSSTWHRTR